MTEINDQIRDGSWFLNEAIKHYRQHRYAEAAAAAEIASASFAAAADRPPTVVRFDGNVDEKFARKVRDTLAELQRQGRM